MEQKKISVWLTQESKTMFGSAEKGCTQNSGKLILEQSKKKNKSHSNRSTFAKTRASSSHGPTRREKHSSNGFTTACRAMKALSEGGMKRGRRFLPYANGSIVLYMCICCVSCASIWMWLIRQLLAHYSSNSLPPPFSPYGLLLLQPQRPNLLVPAGIRGRSLKRGDEIHLTARGPLRSRVFNYCRILPPIPPSTPKHFPHSVLLMMNLRRSWLAPAFVHTVSRSYVCIPSRLNCMPFFSLVKGPGKMQMGESADGTVIF